MRPEFRVLVVVVASGLCTTRSSGLLQRFVKYTWILFKLDRSDKLIPHSGFERRLTLIMPGFTFGAPSATSTPLTGGATTGATGGTSLFGSTSAAKPLFGTTATTTTASTTQPASKFRQFSSENLAS
ncbi:unnamed protein product [Anisakis simplex]|uniref:Secreted protein n=1 Tax=Anisakis simplex TaxID=6269 RepID=A0A0M3JBT4_ANISI|nr:unnamed protein product [Anisakis simplex]